VNQALDFSGEKDKETDLGADLQALAQSFVPQ